MGNSKSVYTKEDKAIYKMAMATRLQREKADVIGDEKTITEINEIVSKLRGIASRLKESEKFSDTMHALDIQLEIDYQIIELRYERTKISEHKNQLAKFRNEAISKLAFIRQYCTEAEEKYKKGQAQSAKGDYLSAEDSYKYAIDYYNKSNYLLSQIAELAKDLGTDLPSYESTTDTLKKVKVLLEPICIANPHSHNNILYAKNSKELKINAQHVNLQALAENQEKETLPTFTKNDFVNVVGLITYNKQTISTNFTDEQAIIICSKMSDSYARFVSAKYQQFSKHVQGGIYRYQLHYLANKSLAFYGGPILTFLMGLRALKFNTHSAYVVNFQRPDNNVSDISVDFPVLTFTTLRGEKYTLAFHLNHNASTSNIRKPIRIFKKGAQVGFIDTKGFIADAKGNLLRKLSSTDSSLLTFCSFLANSKSPAFYSGVETGNCFICDRQLTDPISLRYGIGPICLGKAIN
nr:hypothetical protein [Tanacetum cinerariifolium]